MSEIKWQTWLTIALSLLAVGLSIHDWARYRDHHMEHTFYLIGYSRAAERAAINDCWMVAVSAAADSAWRVDSLFIFAGKQ